VGLQSNNRSTRLATRNNGSIQLRPKVKNFENEHKTTMEDDSLALLSSVPNDPEDSYLEVSPNVDSSTNIRTDDVDSDNNALAPNDHYNLVVVAMGICGAGFLFPFNTYIAASDFLEQRYSKYDPEFYITLIYMWGTSIAVAINTFFVMDHVSVYWRVRFGYFLFFVCFIMFIVIEDSVQRGQQSRFGGWGALLGSVCVVSVGAGVQQSSFYGFASVFGSSYTMSMMFGESFAGVLVSLNRILTKVSYDDSPESVKESTFLFIYLSIAFTVICIIASEWSFRSSFVKNQTRFTDKNTNDKPPINRIQVAKKIKYPIASVFLACFITLALFPGVCIHGNEQNWGDWFGVVVIATFNVADLIGKAMPFSRIKALQLESWSQTKLLKLSLSRVVFFPLIVLTATPVDDPIIRSREVVCIFTFVLAISGGYTATLAMAAGSALCSEAEKEVAGNVMTLALLSGLTCGVSFSIALLYML